VTLTATATVPRTPLPTRVPPTSTAPTATPTPKPTSTPTIAPTLTPTATLTMTATPTMTPTPTATATPIGPVTYSPPKELNFPTRRVKKVSALKFVTMTNPKKNKASVAITSVDLHSQNAGFNIDTPRTTCIAGRAVAAGKNCRVAIFFAPTVKGAASDTLHITGNMTNPGSITLTGAGR